MMPLGRDGVPQDQRVARDDRDHNADGLVFGGVAGPDVLGNRCPGWYPDPVKKGHREGYHRGVCYRLIGTAMTRFLGYVYWGQ